MANPILTSDILKDDGEIIKVEKQLLSFKKSYIETIEEIQKKASSLGESIQVLNYASVQERSEMKKKAEAVEKLEKEYVKYVELLDESEIQLQAIKEAKKQLNQVNKLEAKILTAENGSREQLNAQLKLNKIRLDQMTEAQKKNTAEGKKLADQTSRIEARIVQLNKERKKAKDIIVLERKAAEAAEGSYDQLSAQYSIMKIRLNAMSEAQRQGTKEGHDMEKQAKELYERMKELQSATGKNTLNVGNYADAVSELPGILGQAGQGVQGLQNNFKALLKNPIVLVIGTIAGAVLGMFKAFTKTEKGVQFMNKASGLLNAVWSQTIGLVNNLVEGIQAAFENPGETIKSFGKLLVDQVISRIEAAINLFGIAGKAISQLFTGEFDKLKDTASEAGDALIQLATGLDSEQQKEFSEAIKETTKNIQDQTSAFIDLEVQRRNVAFANRELAKTIEDLTTQEEVLQSIADDSTKSFKEQEDAAAAVRDVIKERTGLEIQLAKNNLDLINREIDLRTQNGEAVDALLDQQLSAYQQLRQAERDYTLTLRQNEKERDQLKQDRLERDLDILLDGFDNQMKINRELIRDESKTFAERQRLLEETNQLSNDSFNKQIETIQKFTGVQIDANELISESDAVALNQKIRSLGLSEIIEGRLLEIVRDRKDANFDLAESEKELNAAKLKFDQDQIKKARELQQVEFDQSQELAKSQFDLLKTSEREKTLFALQQQQERLENELKYNKDLTDIQKATLRNQIALIKRQKEEAENVVQDGDIYDKLGIKLSDEGKSRIKESFEFAKGQLLDFAAKRTEIANQRVNDSANEVSSAENELQNRLALAEQGHAADIDGAKQDLKLAKETQDKALEQRRRAQQQELILQSALQASNLVTATTNIFKDIGFPQGLPFVGLMWGSFLASKARAFQLTKEQRSEGGLDFIGGDTHASGKDTFLNYFMNGKPVYAERGESHMVLKPRPTKRYRKILPSLFHALNTESLETFGNVEKGVSKTQSMIIDDRNSERWLKRIHDQNKEKRYTDSRGNLIVKKGNRTIRYVS